MSKLLCRCGKMLSDSTESNTLEFQVFDENAFLELRDGKYSESNRSFWECPKCGRLTFFAENGVTIARVYRPEPKRPGLGKFQTVLEKLGF